MHFKGMSAIIRKHSDRIPAKVMELPDHLRIKVACIVWWDMELSPLRPLTQQYRRDLHEPPVDELTAALRHIGYTPPAAKHRANLPNGLRDQRNHPDHPRIVSYNTKSTKPRTHIHDNGVVVRVWHCIGPDKTCDAIALKRPGQSWILEEIDTAPAWQRRGHARLVLQKYRDISGHPVLPQDIHDHPSLPFWQHMADIGLATWDRAAPAAPICPVTKTPAEITP